MSPIPGWNADLEPAVAATNFNKSNQLPLRNKVLF